jgi:hypothetical protein
MFSRLNAINYLNVQQKFLKCLQDCWATRRGLEIEPNFIELVIMAISDVVFEYY